MSQVTRIKTIGEMHAALQIPPPVHPYISMIPIAPQLFHGEFMNQLFELDFYQVILKRGIEGSLQYGRNQYDFQDGTLVTTQPKQTLKAEAREDFSQLTGWMLLFHPDLLRTYSLGSTIQEYHFFTYHASEALHLSEKEQQKLSEIVYKIEEECYFLSDRHSDKLIVDNLTLLLDYCTRYYERQFATRRLQNKPIVAQFEDILHTYREEDLFATHGIPSVKYCGEQLHLSPYYLSDLLRNETGSGAQEHIYHFIIETAKNNILNSDKPISQIACELGYSYPTHFSKLFKLKTGVTPNEFRKTARMSLRFT